ncbi:hypothetical protein SO802_008089 [Lithocarpus litseifolius]|uniref:Uncharacterized protein n=1 Tax=Lithocarpus litseifolius TaxID=425828 RepID=A0AAW2D9P6_9ROSI
MTHSNKDDRLASVRRVLRESTKVTGTQSTLFLCGGQNDCYVGKTSIVLNFDLNELPVDEDMAFDEYELPGYENVVFDMIGLPVEDDEDVASNTTSPGIGDSSSRSSELLGPKETYDVLPAVPMDEDVSLNHRELKSGDDAKTHVAKEDNESDQGN